MDDLLKKAMATGILIGIFIIIVFISKFVVNRLLRNNLNKRRRTIVKLLVNVIRYSLFFLGIIIGLKIWEVDTAALLAGASFLGLIVGIGAQKFFSDMINGFFIIFENQYNIDDDVELNGFTGTVVDIGLKTTVLRSFDGKMYALANGDITQITNYSKYPSLAIIFIKVSYKNDITQVEKLIMTFIDSYDNDCEMIIDKPVYSGISGLESDGIVYRITASTMPFEHFGVERWIRRKMAVLFQNNGILPPISVYEKKI